MQCKQKFNVNNKYQQYVTNERLLIFKSWEVNSYSFS